MKHPERTAGAPVDEGRIPWRTQAAVYASGAFGNSSEHVTTVLIPLWALALHAQPFMVGLIIGARHLLIMLLSIHGGSLMDRIGTRRVLLVTGGLAVVVPWLFPALPFAWAAVGLQMVAGLCSTFGWMGAQTQIGQIMKGSPVYAGRLSFFLRFAQLSGPPLAGLCWDLGGPWVGFACLSAWGCGLFAAAIATPHPTGPDHPGTVRFADLIPRPADYIAAFRLMSLPVILMLMMVTVLRMGGNGMALSFYVVYLKGIGYPGTTIGILISAASVLGFAGSLMPGPLTRYVHPYWLLAGSIALTILLVAITPLLGGVFVLLLIASALRGGALGMSQPLMISTLSRAAGPTNQGKAVGLRTTLNRLTTLIIPIAMGGVVELVGINRSFLVVGGILLFLMVPAMLYIPRAQRLERENNPS